MSYIALPDSPDPAAGHPGASSSTSAPFARRSSGRLDSTHERVAAFCRERTRRSRLVIVLGFSAVVLLTILCIPEDHDPLPATKNSISSTVSDGWATVSEWTAPYLGWSEDDDSCDDETPVDHYRVPGLLQVDEKQSVVHRRVRYLPLTALSGLVAKNQTGLEADVDLEDGFDILESFHKAVSLNDEAAADELSFLSNKTILIIGDSVDRFAVDAMCNGIFRGDLSYRNLHKLPAEELPLLDRIEWEQVNSYIDEFSEPRRCELSPKTTNGKLENVNIWSLMIYGVVSGADDWAHKDQTREPRLWDGKLDLFAGAAHARGMQPDLILMNSLLWDLADFNLRDAKAEVPGRALLSLEQVEEFRQKTMALLSKVHEYWPSATKMYRKQHEGKSDAGTWYLHGLDPMPKAIAREPYSYNKINQLNNVVDSLVSSTAGDGKAALHAFPIRHASQDFLQDFKDSVHPGDTGRILYTQMLMYYLKKFTAA